MWLIASDTGACRLLVPIHDLPEGEEQDLWLDLEDPKEKARRLWKSACLASGLCAALTFVVHGSRFVLTAVYTFRAQGSAACSLLVPIHGLK